jgi:hypothetical protein
MVQALQNTPLWSSIYKYSKCPNCSLPDDQPKVSQSSRQDQRNEAQAPDMEKLQ